jgi:hypothetical protein
MQAEIGTLRCERYAARDVGKAFVAALRSEAAPVLQAPQSGDWFTHALRLFGLRARRGLLAPGIARPPARVASAAGR